MGNWLDGFGMAWGMFLAIPCPLRRWNEKAREKMLVCLPLIGLIVGGVWVGVYFLPLPETLHAALLAAAPWLVTGFLHLDGYMDVCDAVLSRRDLETRRKILKDSHCGAFAVICMVLLALAQWSARRRAEAGSAFCASRRRAAPARRLRCARFAPWERASMRPWKSRTAAAPPRCACS